MNVFREDHDDTWADHKAEARKQDRESQPDPYGWSADRAAERAERAERVRDGWWSS